MIEPYIEQYGKRLFGLCVKLCASYHDAQDLYQETWLKAYRNLERYDCSRSFEHWVTRICINAYRDQLRHKKLSPIIDCFRTTEEKEAILEAQEQPPPEEFPEVRAAVDALPAKLRMAVILYYYCDLDIQSAAAVLKIPPGTVKSRLSKARTLLKERLSHEIIL